MEFIGREAELSILNRRLGEIRSTAEGALLAMRGRRRVGKSRLVEEFAARSGCPYLFYTSVQEEGEAELERFARAIGESSLPRAAAVREGLEPQSWEAALELAMEGATAESPLILVLDEFPYLAQKEPSIEAVLQKVWDHTAQRAPVLIILIGSDEAMMEALTEQGRPLYDRARELVIHPLSPADVAEMLDLDPADALDAYLVIGGFPVLALEWGKGRDLRAYLAEALLDPTSFLVVSAERALAAELPGTTHARRVLGAIGSGARAHKEIGKETGLDATAIGRALDELTGRRMVRRLTPYSVRSSPRIVLWEITDPYMRFWLRFIHRRVDLIERGRGSLLLEGFEAGWPTFRGRAIEHVVREAVERLLPDEDRFGSARYVGSYWNRASTIEVDLVGGDRVPAAREIAFIGSIKWRESSPFNRRDTHALAGQLDDVPGATTGTRLVGVSSQGFDDAQGVDVQLGPADLIAAWAGP